MKILLNKYKKLIYILILPYLAISFILVYPAKKAIITPGGLTEVEDFIEIANTNEISNIYTVYVYDFYPATIFQNFITKYNERFDNYIPSIYDTETTISERILMGKISKNHSITNSLIMAYNEASLFKENIKINYNYLGAEIYFRSKHLSLLNIGDIITHIDNMSLTYDDFIEYFKNNNEFTLTINNNKTVKYVKNNTDVFTFFPKYEIISATPSYNIINTNTSGPSGGFMQALSIYLRLMNIDLDLKIAGTGTIGINGDIGKIGGIKQKIYTAIDNNVDYFFMPLANLENLDLNKYGINIIAVSTFKEAVEKINELYY